MSDIRKEIRESFAGLSKEEILDKLVSYGFNVKKGTGKITITDDTINEIPDFRIPTKYTLKSVIGSGKSEVYNTQHDLLVS